VSKTSIVRFSLIVDLILRDMCVVTTYVFRFGIPFDLESVF
jgi:hypothetical protein